MSEICFLPLTEIRDRIRRRELSARAALEAFWQQSQRLNPKINAYVTFNDQAMHKAEEIDKRLANGEHVGPLAGVPMAIKDMLCTKGLRTTAGSKILHNFVPPYSATVVERLEAAGAVTIGKTNQDEFAMGSSNESSYFGPVRNPWSSEHVPGGSSGGSAAAMAAGMAAGSIGTDTGGSIRQPANFCGIVGVKPTYGRVSRYGIVAFASSLDQAGPMTRTVADAATILEVISGYDDKDSTTSLNPVPDWTKSLTGDLRGLTIGLPKEYFSDEVGGDTRKIIDESLRIVREAGAKTVDVSIPLTSFGVPIYYLIATSEASSNLARYDGVRFGYRADFQKAKPTDLEEFYSRSRGEGFGAEVKRRIMLGTYALSSGYYDAFYQKACQVRRLLRGEFMAAFAKCDVLLTPVTTMPAFRLGERVSDPLQMYLNDIYTTSTNLVGIPGMSVPGGFSGSGLPIGVQLSSSHFEESKMMNVGFAIEKALTLWKKVPHGLQ
jgi:aspartyl-tRNA(Asn)/glutamyl-tRNA(Gln) amidotransferase subunit A